MNEEKKELLGELDAIKEILLDVEEVDFNTLGVLESELEEMLSNVRQRRELYDDWSAGGDDIGSDERGGDDAYGVNDSYESD